MCLSARIEAELNGIDIANAHGDDKQADLSPGSHVIRPEHGRRSGVAGSMGDNQE
jgi:hypothetical protein